MHKKRQAFDTPGVFYGYTQKTGGQGFEPQLSHPECDVLPIKLSPIACGTTFLSIQQVEKKGKFRGENLLTMHLLCGYALVVYIHPFIRDTPIAINSPVIRKLIKAIRYLAALSVARFARDQPM